jgi:excisionase family DNA binding protein
LAADIVNTVSDWAAKNGYPSLVREWTPAAGPTEVRKYLAECIAAKEKPKTLTPPEVAKELGCRASSVLAWIKSGKLKASNLATASRPRYRVTLEDLAEFLKSRQPLPKQTRVKTRRRDKPSRF